MDIQYLPDIEHIVFKFDICFKYPISDRISEIVPEYPEKKTIQITVRSFRSVSRSENIHTIFIPGAQLVVVGLVLH